MKTILMKFAGPLQSWGVGSHFETRQTQRYPSKSAVIGILAASLGYRRHEDEKIQQLNNLDFAVRIDQPGSTLRDYHIATKYKANGQVDRNYVTNRYYLQDAVFVVAISSEDNQWIDEVEEALKSPYFQPFLGRRSLPMNADFIIETRNEGILESLDKMAWQAAKWYQKKAENRLEVYVDSHCLPNSNKLTVRDKVVSFSQKERKFGFRSIVKTYIEVDRIENSTEHDAFGLLGG